MVGVGVHSSNDSKRECGAYAGQWLPLAPLTEQKAIASFLDRETAKIDRMVAKVETAIELL
ncbi:MAG: hypothetical protein ACREXW_15620 [Gammaproteobacteria bacterium]